MGRVCCVPVAALVCMALASGAAAQSSGERCPSGIVRYSYVDGTKGHLDFACTEGRTFRLLEVFTVQRNVHLCTLRPPDVCIATSGNGNAVVAPTCDSSANAERRCRISLRLEGPSAYIRYAGGPCGELCGAFGDFEGEYRLQKRLRPMVR